MIDRINYIESTTYDPYATLAMEEYLMLHSGSTSGRMSIPSLSAAIRIHGKNVT